MAVLQAWHRTSVAKKHTEQARQGVLRGLSTGTSCKSATLMCLHCILLAEDADQRTSVHRAATDQVVGAMQDFDIYTVIVLSTELCASLLP